MMKTFGMALVALGLAAAVWASAAALGAAPAAAQRGGAGGRGRGGAGAGVGADGGGAKEMVLDLGDQVTLKLMQIPAGRFLMGNPQAGNNRDADDVPHQVTISKPFYLGITHVTVDQFAAFAKDSGFKTDAERDGWSYGTEIKDGQLSNPKMDGCSWRHPGFDQKGDHPVVQVSWNDATAFGAWLSKKSGKKVGLPTEAQWEYACRAGTKTAYAWGDNPDDGKGWANCADRSLQTPWSKAPAEGQFFSWDDGFRFTSPVGSFKANAFGLLDMTGNAWQWCQDWYGAYDPEAAMDPTGAATGNMRVLRGGSWESGPGDCRADGRGGNNPRDRDGISGFRVAVVTAGG